MIGETVLESDTVGTLLEFANPRMPENGLSFRN